MFSCMNMSSNVSVINVMENLCIYFNSEEAKLIWFSSDFINAILWRKKKTTKTQFWVWICPDAVFYNFRGTFLTSRFCTNSFTLAAVSEDCFPDDASFINVDRKFLHFFTFSIVSLDERVKGKQSEKGKQTLLNTWSDHILREIKSFSSSLQSNIYRYMPLTT